MLWKTLKVFISSTFLDMEMARDRLVHIFNEIERNILSRQLTIRPYDLRWRDRHANEDISTWCLRQLEKCDYFIAILGERYGWRPPQCADGTANSQNISITEMEIRQALSGIDKKRRFFCFFSGNHPVTESEEDQASVRALKEYLQQQDETIFWFHDVEDLALIINRQFRLVVDNEFPPGEKVASEIYTYRQALDETVNEKIAGFVGRETWRQYLHKFIKRGDYPNYLAIEAVAGTGKSALLAQLIDQCRREKFVVVGHYMSMGGNSRQVRGILASLGEQLYDSGQMEPLSADPGEWRSQIHHALKSTAEQLLLIIDGLDEVDEDGSDLLWLPRVLPANVRVVISLRPVEVGTRLADFPYLTTIELPAFCTQETLAMIAGYCQHNRLQLTEEDRILLEHRAQGNPLFLKVALEEIGCTGMAVGQLAVSVDALFDQILARLANVYGQQLIDDYLGAIAAGKDGIQEKELAEILAIGDDRLLRITKALDHFTLTRRGMLTFFHPQFRRNVMMRMGKGGMRLYHRRLAVYFREKGYDYLRCLQELPYQLQWAECYEQLLETLSDWQFLSKKCYAKMVRELRADIDYAVDGVVVKIPKELWIAVGQTRVGVETLRLISRALHIESHFLLRHPHSLFQILWNLCYWHDCPLASAHYDSAPHSTPPWEKKGDRLYLLAESWRENYEKNEQGFWLQSLRPLPIRLDHPLLEIISGHRGAVTNACLDRDGTRLVSASMDGTIRIWDSASGLLLHTLTGHESGVYAAAFSPDGSKVASAGIDKTVRIWNAQTQESLAVLSGHRYGVNAVVFSPDGTRLVSASLDQTVRIWDVGQARLLKTLAGHKASVKSLAISADGATIVSGSYDRTVGIWDPVGGRLIMSLSGHTGSVKSVAISATGDLIASGSYDKTARVWDRAGQTLAVLKDHGSIVESVCFSPDGKKIATGCYDDKVRIWDVGSGRLLHRLYGHEGCVKSVCFSPDSNFVFSGSQDQTIRRWDTRSEQQLLSLHGHDLWVLSVALSPNGSKVATGSIDGTVRVWNTASGELVHTLSGHEGTIKSVRFSPDGSKIVSGCVDKKVRVWDGDSGELIQTFSGHEGGIRSIKFAADGTIISGSYHNTIRVWPAQRSDLKSQDVVIARRLKISDYQVVAGEVETMVQGKNNQQSLAFFPRPLKDAKISPDDILTGAFGNYFCVMRLCQPPTGGL